MQPAKRCRSTTQPGCSNRGRCGIGTELNNTTPPGLAGSARDDLGNKYISFYGTCPQRLVIVVCSVAPYLNGVRISSFQRIAVKIGNVKFMAVAAEPS